MPLLRWVFLIGPARAYLRAGEAGRAPWLHYVAIAGATAAGAAIGAGIGWIAGDTGEGFEVGISIGALLSVSWFLYGLILVAVMRLKHQPLESLAGTSWLKRPRRWWDT